MLKTAVIGVGYLGRFHAQKYVELTESELFGVVDVDSRQGQKVADEIGVPYFDDFNDVLDQVDAVSIVVPTVHHYKTAKAFLDKGVHVLIEKPFAAKIEEAEELEQLSREKNLCLQIGHLERFNPVFTEFQGLIDQPKFIENIRIAPFPKRGTDVDVILDLMIHDIDIVLSIVKSKTKSVNANGVCVINETPDICNARVEFENGCVANFTASRISLKNMRKTRFFQSNAYISIDFLEKKTEIVQIKDTKNIDEKYAMVIENSDGKKKQIFYNNPDVKENNAILEEHNSFAKSILDDSIPIVSLKDGLDALKLASEILKKIK